MNVLNFVTSVGKIGKGISDSLDNRAHIEHSRNMYQQQVAANMEVIAFNSLVASRAGNIRTGNIIRQTQEVVGTISAKTAYQGTDPEITKLLIDAAVTKGMHAGYESAFNTEVELANYQLQGRAMQMGAASKMEEFNVMKKENQSNLIDQMMGVVNLIGTNFSNMALQRKPSGLPTRTISNQV